jgi:hypothetical protein
MCQESVYTIVHLYCNNTIEGCLAHLVHVSRISLYNDQHCNIQFQAYTNGVWGQSSGGSIFSKGYNAVINKKYKIVGKFCPTWTKGSCEVCHYFASTDIIVVVFHISILFLEIIRRNRTKLGRNVTFVVPHIISYFRFIQQFNLAVRSILPSD